MIGDAILDVFQGLGSWIIGRLPEWPLDLSALDGIGNGTGLVFGLVDMVALRNVVGTMVAWEVGSWVVGLLLRIWNTVKP